MLPTFPLREIEPTPAIIRDLPCFDSNQRRRKNVRRQQRSDQDERTIAERRAALWWRGLIRVKNRLKGSAEVDARRS